MRSFILDKRLWEAEMNPDVNEQKISLWKFVTFLIIVVSFCFIFVDIKNENYFSAKLMLALLVGALVSMISVFL